MKKNAKIYYFGPRVTAAVLGAVKVSGVSVNAGMVELGSNVFGISEGEMSFSSKLVRMHGRRTI